MKRAIATSIKNLFQSKWGWFFVQFVMKSIDWMAFYKKEVLTDMEKTADERLRSKLFKDLVVVSGPFTGLKYVKYASKGSTLYPKLLGSYESELHSIVNKIINEATITQIIDIGCAEGYYAVGFAKFLPKATVFCYDIDFESLQICKEMAALNNVSERLFLGNLFTPSTFSHFDFKNHSLVFCDCEGYELQIFTEQTVPLLKEVILIIELHDFIDRSISLTLKLLLSNSHELEIVETSKRSITDYPLLKGFNTFQQIRALDELRPEKMQWLIATPKNGE